MRLALFVEGETEKYLPEFLKRWLDPKLDKAIRINPVNLGGAPNYLKEFTDRVRRVLDDGHVSGAVGLIDLYRSTLHLPDGTVDQKYDWAKQELERQVARARFRQHFAVHETEAWLLSDSAIFPRSVAEELPKAFPPETINFQNPPSHRLKDLYRRKLGKKYEKPTDGAKLFRKLDPNIAYNRCPHLKYLLDELLVLAAEVVKE